MVVKIKKTKSTKKCVIKKLKFENYKNCLEAVQLENKIEIDSFFCYKRKYKELIKNDKLILNTTRFRSEKHKVFIEEINKITFTSHDDKRMQSIDLIETYAYGMNKDIVGKKEEIKCNTKIKQDKNA